MGKLKDYLIAKGLGEELISNPAFDGLLADAEKVFEAAPDSRIEIVDKGELYEKMIVKDEAGKVILAIDPVIFPKSCSFNLYGYKRSLSLDQYGDLKVREEMGDIHTRRYIKDRVFDKTGLESKFSERLETPYAHQVIKDVYREHNGYVAYVGGVNVDTEDPNLKIIEKYSGYINLDLRYNELDGFGIKNSMTVNTGDLKENVPHKIEALPDNPNMSPEAILYIQKGIKDMSPEERKRWESYYQQPFEVIEAESFGSPIL